MQEMNLCIFVKKSLFATPVHRIEDQMPNKNSGSVGKNSGSVGKTSGSVGKTSYTWGKDETPAEGEDETPAEEAKVAPLGSEWSKKGKVGALLNEPGALLNEPVHC